MRHASRIMRYALCVMRDAFQECAILPAMSPEPKKPEPKGTIDAFRLLPQSFGRLTVQSTTLNSLPRDAFKSRLERKSATTPPPARQSRD